MTKPLWREKEDAEDAEADHDKRIDYSAMVSRWEGKATATSIEFLNTSSNEIQVRM
jgi:hypothetical protein